MIQQLSGGSRMCAIGVCPGALVAPRAVGFIVFAITRFDREHKIPSVSKHVFDFLFARVGL